MAHELDDLGRGNRLRSLNEEPRGAVHGELDALSRIAEWLEEIGLDVRWEVIEGSTAMAGITIDSGVLVIDAAALDHPGDLLHEAGHLAVVTGAARAEITGSTGSDGGLEMAAIAWSYAALRHLSLHPTVVFHEDGYRGGSSALIENFSAGRYLGVPLLQWLGLTVDAGSALELGIDAYPHMVKWVVA
jgi:hypothetical protein